MLENETAEMTERLAILRDQMLQEKAARDAQASQKVSTGKLRLSGYFLGQYSNNRFSFFLFLGRTFDCGVCVRRLAASSGRVLGLTVRCVAMRRKSKSSTSPR